MTFNKGDLVRIGRGKVEYRVLSNQTLDTVDIESMNTGKAQTVASERLVLIEAAPLSEAGTKALIDYAKADVEATRALFVGEDKNDHRESSYGVAILKGLQFKHVYEGTVGTETIAKRRKAGKVQKQGRKANR